MSDKLPAYQFYPADWLSDPALRSVGYAARGLWKDLLCLMHKSDRRGYLQLNGQPVSPDQIARMTGGAADEVARLLQELKDAGVSSATEDGILFSRRMVADEHKRKLCQEAGKRGGNPTLKGPFKGPQTPRVKRNPTPSSSASSSPAEKGETAKDSAADAAPRDSRIAGLTKYFYDRLEARLKEKPSGFNGGQAGTIWKTLLKDFTEDDIKKRIDNWLCSTRPFIVENIQNIGLFRNNFASLKAGPIFKPENGGTHGKQPVAGYSAPGRSRLADPE